MQIASIRFHSMTDDVDLVIHGQSIKLKSSTWSSSHEMKSPLGTLKWKNKDVFKGGDMKCADGTGEVVARFEVGKWAKVQKVSWVCLCLL